MEYLWHFLLKNKFMSTGSEHFWQDMSPPWGTLHSKGTEVVLILVNQNIILYSTPRCQLNKMLIWLRTYHTSRPGYAWGTSAWHLESTCRSTQYSDDFNCYSLFWTNVFNNDPLIFILLINNYLTIGTINNATLFFTCFSCPLNITHEYLW